MVTETRDMQACTSPGNFCSGGESLRFLGEGHVPDGLAYLLAFAASFRACYVQGQKAARKTLRLRIQLGPHMDLTRILFDLLGMLK